MNTKLKTLYTLGLSALAWLASPQNAKAEYPPQMFGVNVTGGENGLSPTEVYGFGWFYPSDADLDYLKSKGVELVRVPFRWERVQPTPGGALSTAEMNQLSLLMDRI